MSTPVFVLAGGLGTRLRPVSGETPKVLMPVAGKPFLRRLVEALVEGGYPGIVLCLGYGADAVLDHFKREPVAGATLQVSIEDRPLGTAGALRLAEHFWATQNLILNGDTDLSCDYAALAAAHSLAEAGVTIGLARMANAARFGRVECDADGRVLSFREKESAAGTGLVNAGVYVAEWTALDAIPHQGPSSIEREWLPGLLHAGVRVCGSVVAEGFTDIGTPEDYWRLANRA